METALFALIVTAILVILMSISYSHQVAASVWLLLGLLIGVSIWLRPEGVTLLGPVILGALLTQTGKPYPWKKVLAVVAGFLLLFGPYLIFNRQLAGEWWPNTFYAKQAEYAILRELPLLRRLVQQFTLPLLGAGVLLLPGFVAAAWQGVQRRQWGLIFSIIWLVGHLVLYAFRLPVTYQHGRYAIPMLPIFFLIGILGMAETARLSSPVLLPRVVSRVWVMTSGAVLAGFWVIGLNAYVEDVTIIETEMVDTAQWIAQNTEPDATIAAHDIGALGYFAPRPILDLAGLVSPDVIPFIRDEAQLAEYIDEQDGTISDDFPKLVPSIDRGP